MSNVAHAFLTPLMKNTVGAFDWVLFRVLQSGPEMETGQVDRHRLGQPAPVEILRPARQASQKSGQILLSYN